MIKAMIPAIIAQLQRKLDESFKVGDSKVFEVESVNKIMQEYNLKNYAFEIIDGQVYFKRIS